MRKETSMKSKPRRDGAGNENAFVPIPTPIDRATGYLLRRAHSAFVAHWQLSFRGSKRPITPVQGGMLAVIDHHQDLTQTALAKLMNVEGPTLLQSLTRLEENGYIKRTPRKDDNRSNSLELTPRGRKVLKAVMEFIPERDTTLLAVLSADERRTLQDLLTRVVEHSHTIIKDLSETKSTMKSAAARKPRTIA
jgi:DNA-binding MarR family transcriptional regulator